MTKRLRRIRDKRDEHNDTTQNRDFLVALRQVLEEFVRNQSCHNSIRALNISIFKLAASGALRLSTRELREFVRPNASLLLEKSRSSTALVKR